MPNFPPGTPNTGSATPVPVLVFVPTPTVQATVRVQNTGVSTLYFGGANVSAVNGFPVAVGNRPVELQNIHGNLYVASGIGSVVQSTAASAGITVGTNVITVANSNPTYFTTGTYIQVGSGTGLEYLQVNSVSTNGLTVVTFTNTLYDHLSGSTVSTVTAAPSGYVATAGVV